MFCQILWLTKITPCLCDINVNFNSVNSSSCHSKYTSTALSIFDETFEDHIKSNFTAGCLLIIINWIKWIALTFMNQCDRFEETCVCWKLVTSLKCACQWFWFIKPEITCNGTLFISYIIFHILCDSFSLFLSQRHTDTHISISDLIIQTPSIYKSTVFIGFLLEEMGLSHTALP